LDLQIPDLKLAIEVQGPTHYSDLYGNLEAVKKRDAYKKQWCQTHGVQLMHIEWEGYMKTIYRLPEATRRERFGLVVKQFLSEKIPFIEITESQFLSVA